MKLVSFTFGFLISSLVFAGAEGPVGIFDESCDVGNPKLAGSSSFDDATGTYRIRGAGANMWAAQDQFQFSYKKLKGDFILRAEIRFLGESDQNHRKGGWIIRDSLEDDSKHVNASLHAGDGLIALQFRKTKGGITESVVSPDVGPSYLQLERRGDRYLMSSSTLGSPLKTVEVSGVSLENEVYVGLYVCSHSEDEMETAVFQNVNIVHPGAFISAE
jgi:TolB protein